MSLLFEITIIWSCLTLLLLKVVLDSCSFVSDAAADYHRVPHERSGHYVFEVLRDIILVYLWRHCCIAQAFHISVQLLRIYSLFWISRLCLVQILE